MSDNLLENIQDQIERLEKLQTQAISKKRGKKDSVDTTNARSYTNLLSSFEANQEYLDIAYSTDEWIRTNTSKLYEIVELANRALALAKSDTSNKLDPTSLHEIKSEYKSILNQIINLANSRSNSNYIFAGTKVNTKPFNLNESLISFTYHGDDNEISRTLGPGEQLIININGRKTFTNLLTSLIKGTNLSNISDLRILIEEFRHSLDTLNKMLTINKFRHKQVLTSIKQGEKTNLLLQTLNSQDDNINIMEGITNLQQKETAYKTVLEVCSRTLAIINLFDLT